MDIQYGTSTGQVRENNEDYASVYYNQSNQVLALLADGMGGHNAGDVASKLLVTTMGELFNETNNLTIDAAKEWLSQVIKEQNHHIYQLGEQYDSMAGMGTTIVAVAIIKGYAIIAHVGDSRVYKYQDDTLTCMTEDHSLVNELLRSGGITEEMAENHPQKHYLTRTIGMKGDISADISLEVLNNNEQFLLCSDGLTNMLTDDQIADIMSQNQSVKEKVSALIEAANLAGGRDNITVVVIDGKEGSGT